MLGKNRHAETFHNPVFWFLSSGVLEVGVLCVEPAVRSRVSASVIQSHSTVSDGPHVSA